MAGQSSRKVVGASPAHQTLLAAVCAAGTRAAQGLFAALFPGSSYTGSFRPFVAMSQNMLPFDWAEAQRYGMSFELLKLMLLRKSQKATFGAARGMIFLSKYAAKTIAAAIKLRRPSTTIPHGIDRSFSSRPPPSEENRELLLPGAVPDYLRFHNNCIQTSMACCRSGCKP